MKVALILVPMLLFACIGPHKSPPLVGKWETPQHTINCDSINGKVILEGSYQGQNVYVQNPFASCSDTSIIFCTASVTINDSISLPNDSIAMSCYRIPLTSYNLKQGDPVRIVIKHYPGCAPRVLNPEVR